MPSFESTCKSDSIYLFPQDGFKYIKYPVSFRASLVQVSNEGWKAFNQAHNNMSQIAMYSDLIPAKVSDALNLLVKGTALEINIVSRWGGIRNRN